MSDRIGVIRQLPATNNRPVWCTILCTLFSQHVRARYPSDRNGGKCCSASHVTRRKDRHEATLTLPGLMLVALVHCPGKRRRRKQAACSARGGERKRRGGEDDTIIAQQCPQKRAWTLAHIKLNGRPYICSGPDAVILSRFSSDFRQTTPLH